MVLLLVFMQLTRDLFAIAKFLLSYRADRQTHRITDADELLTPATVDGVSSKNDNVVSGYEFVTI